MRGGVAVSQGKRHKTEQNNLENFRPLPGQDVFSVLFFVLFFAGLSVS